MKTIELKAAPREQIGKRVNKDLRGANKVPAVIYHNSEATHIILDERSAKQAIYTPDTYLVKLDLDGQWLDAVIRESQFDPITEKLLHVDFLQVDERTPVTLTLPVRLIGTPVGVTKGGRLVTKLRRIKVKGIPAQMPQAVEVNVADLDLGGTIKVKDAQIEGLQIITSPSAAVASVEIPRSLRSAKEGGKK
ncbi:MAG: 50S ribosomal protein L25/general stress protein Ctc [Bacteroidia bacterium]